MLAMRPHSVNNIGLGNMHSASVGSLVIVENQVRVVFPRAGYRHKLKLHSQGSRCVLGFLDDARHCAIAVCMWIPEDSDAPCWGTT